MATATKRAIRSFEHAGEAAGDALFEQIASLRKELASLSDAVNDYGGHAAHDFQQNAIALAKDFQHQGTKVARQVSRQANVAGKAVQENPVPVIVALGTIALISALIFSRD